MGDRVVWVSGASSGLGRAAAVALKASGWRVVSGARSFTGGEGETDSGVRLPLDVRSPESISVFCEQAVSLSGLPDAVVSTAAILTLGAAEDTTPAEFQAVMDTTFLGSVRFVQAALPLMRAKGGGKVVLFSSYLGLMGGPFQGPYVAAKHALEGFSECLALETRGQGIQVMLVEPGDHSGGAQQYRGMAAHVSPLYRESLDRVRETYAKNEADGGDPRRLGRKLARVMDRKRLPKRLRVMRFLETLAVIVHDATPGRLLDRLHLWYLKA